MTAARCIASARRVGPGPRAFVHAIPAGLWHWEVMTRLRSLLFPDRPREFRGRRSLKIGLRALHVACVALLLGSHAFTAPDPVRTHWLAATGLSGCLLLALDLHESAVFLLQVRGAVLVTKLLALGWLAADAAAHPHALGALLILSVLSSHAPASIRYRVLLWRDRVTASASRG